MLISAGVVSAGLPGPGASSGPIQAAGRPAGGILALGPGTQAGSGVVTVSGGETLAGSGTAHHAFYVAGTRRGTALVRRAGRGGHAVELESALNGYGGFGLRDLSIYHQGTGHARSAVHVAGIQRPQLLFVEAATLENGVADYGFLLEPQGANLTLYGVFIGLYASSSNGSGLRTGLGLYEDTNANAFIGGCYQGTHCALEVGGQSRTPIANAFVSSAFEGVYSSAFEHEFVPNGSGVVGPPEAPGDCYVVKLVKLSRAQGLVFTGCYFELGGVPETYDDGVHGRHPLYAVVSLEGPGVRGVTIDTLEICYLYDKGAIGTDCTMGGGRRYSTRSGAALSLRPTRAQRVRSNTETTVALSGGQVVYRPDTISYDESGVGTVHMPGVYRIEANVTFEGFDARGTFTFARIVSDGGNAKGGNVLLDGSVGPVPITASVGATLYLDRGQHFRITVMQTSGADQLISRDAEYSRLAVVRIA